HDVQLLHRRNTPTFLARGVLAFSSFNRRWHTTENSSDRIGAEWSDRPGLSRSHGRMGPAVPPCRQTRSGNVRSLAAFGSRCDELYALPSVHVSPRTQ